MSSSIDDVCEAPAAVIGPGGNGTLHSPQPTSEAVEEDMGLIIGAVIGGLVLLLCCCCCCLVCVCCLYKKRNKRNQGDLSLCSQYFVSIKNGAILGIFANFTPY